VPEYCNTLQSVSQDITTVLCDLVGEMQTALNHYLSQQDPLDDTCYKLNRIYTILTLKHHYFFEQIVAVDNKLSIIYRELPSSCEPVLDGLNIISNMLFHVVVSDTVGHFAQVKSTMREHMIVLKCDPSDSEHDPYTADLYTASSNNETSAEYQTLSE
jgi:hypothetical protein